VHAPHTVHVVDELSGVCGARRVSNSGDAKHGGCLLWWLCGSPHSPAHVSPTSQYVMHGM
jgi:hypothetical protein